MNQNKSQNSIKNKSIDKKTINKILKKNSLDTRKMNSNELEFDTNDVNVELADGIMIKNCNDEMRILFYYFKPEIAHEAGQKIKCKCVSEFRISRTTFLEIVTEIHDTIKQMDEQNNKNIIMEDNKIIMYA